MRETERDSFDNQLMELVGKYIDRWLICSQWSGLWSRSTDVALGNLATRLSALNKALSKTSEVETAIALIKENIAREVSDQVEGATQYIDTLSASRRNQVRIYRVPLWVWNRIDADRWKAAQPALRLRTRKKPKEDVDHIIAYSIWEKRIGNEGAPETYTLEEVEGAINGFGNCMLLEKNFNISKGAKDLHFFMQSIHPFDNAPDHLPQWYETLNISQPLQSNAEFSLEILLAAIEKRTDQMRTDLTEFVSGEVIRCDLD